MSKRISCIILCLLLAVVSFASCSNAPAASSTPAASVSQSSAAPAGQDAAPEESVGYEFPLKEPVTFTMFTVINNIEIGDTLAMQKREEMTNVHWEIQSAMSVDLAEKRNLLLASNQYPDVFFKASVPMTDVDKYGSQGIFVPLNDAIEKYGTNIKQVMEDRPAIRQMITSEDGNIYCLREVNEQLPPDGNIAYLNSRWLANVGMETPKTVEDLYNVLVAFKEQDANGNGDPNDEIPYSFTGGQNNTKSFYYLMPFFGVPIDFNSRTVINDGKIEYAMNTDTYKEYLAWNRKIYDEGLMDPNAFTTTFDQLSAIGQSGDTLGFFFDMGAFRIVGRDRDDEFEGLDPFIPNTFVPTVGASSVGTFVVTDKCADPELAFAWQDYFYGEEGGILAWMGIEGESYKINSDGTWDWILGEHKDLGTVREYAGIQGNGAHPSVKPKLWFSGITDPDEKLLIDIRERLVAQSIEPFPALRYSDSDTKTLASIQADINPYLLQYASKIVTGQQDLDATWDEYKTTLENMGLSKMLEIYNTAYNKLK